MEDNIVDLSSDIISNVCMEGKSYTNLPLDVIYEVLLRLPMEDLMRCQGVCKTWHNLINEPDFHNMQFKRALSQPPRIMLAPYTRTGHDPTSSLYLMMNNGKCKEIPVNEFELKWGYNITNSCNGLFCINTGGLHSPVYIYNPITRESMELPEQDHESFKLDGVLYGFGFDQISRKYKVVCVYRPYYWDTDYYEGNVTEKPVTTGEILTEGENVWRKLEFPHQIQFHQARTVFLDGAFHWMINRDYETFDSAHVLVLDISSEKFGIINIPPSIGIPDSMILTDIAGSLTFVEYDSLDTSAHLWRLVGSRTDDICIWQYSCEFVSKSDGVKYYCRALGRCNDGSFLYKATDCVQGIGRHTYEEDVRCFEVKASDHLAVYIPEKKQSFILQMVGAPDCFNTVFFKPTLVSPKSICFPYKEKIPKVKRGLWSKYEIESLIEKEENSSDNESPDLETEWILRKGEAARKRSGRKGRRNLLEKRREKSLNEK